MNTEQTNKIKIRPREKKVELNKAWKKRRPKLTEDDIYTEQQSGIVLGEMRDHLAGCHTACVKRSPHIKQPGTARESSQPTEEKKKEWRKRRRLTFPRDGIKRRDDEGRKEAI